jgi:porin
LAPDAQYIIHPGGGMGLPENDSKRIPDAAVLGLRALLKL